MKLSVKSLAIAAVVALGLPAAAPTLAGPATQALGQCLSSSTTPDDDIVLVRWVFVLMSKHPKVSDMATITPEKEDQINRQVGVLFTRLLAENCAKETSEAIKTDGDTAMENAFEALGQKAFGGLTSDPAVSASSQQFVKYVDLNKVYQVMVVQPGVK